MRARFVLLPILAMACDTMPPITEPFKLAGDKVVTAEQLENGREMYMLYCRACHGEQGDGRGPAGIGLRPPPRDFRTPYFKFGGVEAGELPPDSEIKRIVLGGLDGTAMLPWKIPEKDLDDVINYTKTFAKDEDGVNVWQEDEPGELVEIPEDPWTGKKEEAIKKGKQVYHGLAQCLKCHPAYATYQEIWDATAIATGEGSTSAFREGMYFPEAKYAEAYKHKLLPPDFVRHPIKAGTTTKDIYRTIAAGIGGTAMPMWKGSIDDADIYAISYFVEHLYNMDDDVARKARQEWLAQPEFVPPTAAGEDGEEGDGEKPEEAPAEPEEQ